MVIENQLKKLMPERLIVSSLASYAGDRSEEICDYENEAIMNWTYCLWTCAARFNPKLVRAFCKKIEDEGGTPYVLIRPVKGEGSKANARKFVFPTFKTEDFEDLLKEYPELIRDLQVTVTEADGVRTYWVPGYGEKDKQSGKPPMDCSASECSSPWAFVGERLATVREYIDIEKFLEGFDEIQSTEKPGLESIKIGSETGFLADAAGSLLRQHHTGCIQLKKGSDRTVYQQLPDGSGSMDCYLLTLKAPYIVVLGEGRPE